MRLKMARHLPLLAVVALALAGPTMQDALASDHFPHHWGREDRSSLRLRVGENLTGSWEPYLRDSVKEWEDSDVVELRIVNGSTRPDVCDENRGQVEVCNFEYGKTGWLGLTRIHFFTDDPEHITAAEIRLNDTYFERDSAYKGKDGRNARDHTMCHELGHAFGLVHTGDKSCMNNSGDAIFDNLDPIGGDFRDLRDIYRHRDDKNESTVDRSAARTILDDGSRGTGFIDIEQTPHAASDAVGRETRMVEELPDGQTVVTYVTWAE